MSRKLDRLAGEHVANHGLLERLDAALVAYARDPGRFTDLAAAVNGLAEALVSHLGYEEHELVEPLSRMGL